MPPIQFYTYTEYAKLTGRPVADVVKRYSPYGFAFNADGEYVICYNDALAEEKPFTVAHELAHIILNHVARDRQGLDPEQQADMLASCMLAFAEKGAEGVLCSVP